MAGSEPNNYPSGEYPYPQNQKFVSENSPQGFSNPTVGIYQGGGQQGFPQGNFPNGYGHMVNYAVPSNPKQYQGQSWVTALLLCLFLGGLGVHNFYLSKKGAGLTQLTLFIIGVLTTAVVLGWLVLAVVGLSVIIDLVRILLNREQFD